MNILLYKQIIQLNPWLAESLPPRFLLQNYLSRFQAEKLLSTAWDDLWLILTGPRRAGKTMLARHLCQEILSEGRFTQLLYINCDFLECRDWLKTPYFLQEAIEEFKLSNFILFIDEVQRLESPGLLLKAIADLQLPIKMIATGSSQLEMKSKVQEFLTGRQLTSLVLPLSYLEGLNKTKWNALAIYGAYPQVVLTSEKEILLKQIYDDYINKDIIEILKLSKPDVMRKLLTLLAHSSGQLANYQQLATDCQVSTVVIKNYLDILQQTYVIAAVTPFVGNKRSEVTKNPIFYFIDNGFRNQALNNFSFLEHRSDAGLLIQNFIFQELLKFKTQRFLSLDIHYWRTTSGAEVDFVLYKNEETLLPIEVKFQSLSKPTVTRGFRSFIESYQPKQAVIITKDYKGKKQIDHTEVHFIPLDFLVDFFKMLECFF